MTNTQTVSRVSFLELLKLRVSDEELKTIEDAYTLSKYGHRNQLRDQGTRYFEHPKEVALILVDELGIYDSEMIIMALLHDIIEDTFILSDHGLEKLFGKRVVEGLRYLTKTDTVEHYLERMAQCEDMGVIIVKFADRLHNLRTLDGVTKEKRERKIKETKELYLPLLKKDIQSEKSKTVSATLVYLKDEILKNL